MRLSRNFVIAFFVKKNCCHTQLFHITMKQHYATHLYQFFRKRINLIQNGTTMDMSCRTPPILHTIEAVGPPFAIPCNFFSNAISSHRMMNQLKEIKHKTLYQTNIRKLLAYVLLLLRCVLRLDILRRDF